MTKQDMEYRQGRSKRQVEKNEKVGFAGLLFLVIVLGLTLIITLITTN